MPSVEELEAQLEVARLEAELVQAKDGDGPDRDLKLRVREARQTYREIYRSPSSAAGDGTAEPASVVTAADVQKGGK